MAANKKSNKTLFTVGEYGSSVSVIRRARSPNLYLRIRATNKWSALGHAELERAKEQARELRTTLESTAKAQALGVTTVGMVFARWEKVKTPTLARPKEDQRRLDLWQWFLKDDTDAHTVGRDVIDAFVERRKKGLGELRISSDDTQPYRFGPVTLYTVGADVKWLKQVFKWATHTSPPLLRYNPLSFADKDYQRKFLNKNKRQPIASQDHLEDVLKACVTIEPRFPFWLRFANALGWRETEICHLRYSAFNKRTRKVRYWNPKTNSGWDVPLTEEVREVLDDFLQAFPGVGDTWMFPAPRADGPWREKYPNKLILQAEKAAGVQEHFPPHAYRRKWVTERLAGGANPKALAQAGGWASVRTLDIYNKPSDDMVFEAASKPVRLRRAQDV